MTRAGSFPRGDTASLKKASGLLVSNASPNLTGGIKYFALRPLPGHISAFLKRTPVRQVGISHRERSLSYSPAHVLAPVTQGIVPKVHAERVWDFTLTALRCQSSKIGVTH